MDVTSIQCSGIIEWLNGIKVVTKRVKCTTMTLRLLRNEFRELLLEVESNKCKHKFHLESVNIHKKFVTEGKATIQTSNITLMISNAPAAHLVPFLKTLFIKLSSKKQSPKVKLREQLLSNKPRVLEEISPINSKDVNRVKSQIQVSNLDAKKKRLNEQSTIEASKRQRTFLIQNVELTPEQKDILEAATSKQNIFFTGSAGTGKSFLLRYIINVLPPDETVATASTGAAACLIGGITLHSFTGIGGGNATLDRSIELASRPSVAQNWRKCKYLIIDEISMIDAEYFEKIEEVARHVRRSEEPFGGIKLILCGDFLQLPPVNKNSNAKFCFQTSAWTKCQLKCFNLKHVHRQSDSEFIQILNDIRLGKVTEESAQKLKFTAKNDLEKDGIVPTRLCCKTSEAQLINEHKLMQLTGKENSYTAVDEGSEKMLEEQTPVPKMLILKEGAQVMLLKNLSVSGGLVNGARGIVTSFDSVGLPVVQFCSGGRRTIGSEKWVVKSPNGFISSRKQIPLRLAWAFSIHKSQGLTLDCVEMSLSGVFEAGQAYVALSRARSLESLRVVDFNTKYVWANQDVIKFYKKLEYNLSVARLHKLG